MKCKVCGRPEEDHHEFVAQRVMPEGCVCDPGCWLYDRVPPVCGSYQRASDRNDYCLHCQHDKGCHK